jgi:hypothetical protein
VSKPNKKKLCSGLKNPVPVNEVDKKIKPKTKMLIAIK